MLVAVVPAAPATVGPPIFELVTYYASWFVYFSYLLPRADLLFWCFSPFPGGERAGVVTPLPLNSGGLGLSFM